MFKLSRRTTLIILAVLTALFLYIAYAIDAGAAVEFSESQEGCLEVSEVAWSGQASSSDEWYEIHNTCDFDFAVGEFYIQTTNESLEVAQAYLPDVQIPANGYCLFERTDDQAVSNRSACGIHGSNGTGESLTGIFPNTDVVAFGLFTENPDMNDLHYHEMILDGDWPAGSSAPRASMQKVGGVWITSNHGDGALDADNQPILGTPGQANQPNVGDPATCGTLPDQVAYDLDMTTLEDGSGQASITVDAKLWGVDPIDSSLIATEGQFSYVWTQGAWQLSIITWDDETGEDCIDALEMAKDATDNVLQGHPSGVADQASWWSLYANWLNHVLQFQKSGLSTVFLPSVQN